MKDSTTKDKRKRKHWFFITRSECVICGRGGDDREYRKGTRPKSFKRRFKFEAYVCDQH
jgi:hypothetical protein